MSDIAGNIIAVKEQIPSHVKLVAVSKQKPVEDILEAYNCGHRVFGENRAQELIEKAASLPDDVEWHFIGHLQSNKVKFIVPFIHLIQSVDSFKILKVINKEAYKNGRVVDCLLQFYIAKEETKYGFSPEAAAEMLKSDEFMELLNVKICGVMGMASFVDDQEQIRNEFVNLRNIFQTLKDEYLSDSKEFKEISMGMSGDYMIAVEEGSTIIRLGTKIFTENS